MPTLEKQSSRSVRAQPKHPDLYFDAAMKLLAERGAGSLTVAAVCARLRVTKGSFYHHFRGWDDFVARLLSSWAREQTERVIELSEAASDTQARLDMLIEFAAALPHRSEAAIRAWGRSDGEVSRAVARVDKRRQRYLTEVFGHAVGGDERRALLLAQGAMSILVGVQQLRADPKPNELRELLRVYRTLLEPGSPRNATAHELP